MNTHILFRLKNLLLFRDPFSKKIIFGLIGLWIPVAIILIFSPYGVQDSSAEIYVKENFPTFAQSSKNPNLPALYSGQLQMISDSLMEDSFDSALALLQMNNPDRTFSVSALSAIKEIEQAFFEVCQEKNLSLKNILLSESAIRKGYSGSIYPYSAISMGILTPLSLKERNDFIKTLSKKLAQKSLSGSTPQLNQDLLFDENGNYVIITWNALITHTIHFSSEKESEDLLQKTLAELSATSAPTLTIIIDDMGENKRHMQNLIDLPFPVVFSIWPRSSHATYAALLAHERGLPVYLHQPMQTRAGIDMGSGGLTKSMSQEKMSSVLKDNLLSVPYVYGINNHTGSVFTQSEPAVEKFLLAMKEINPNMLLMDSKTTERSVFYNKSIEHGFPTQKRTFFIDNNADVGYILRQLDTALEHAQVYGSAVVIGHSRDSTMEALKQWRAYENTNVVIDLPNFY